MKKGKRSHNTTERTNEKQNKNRKQQLLNGYIFLEKNIFISTSKRIKKSKLKKWGHPLCIHCHTFSTVPHYSLLSFELYLTQFYSVCVFVVFVVFVVPKSYTQISYSCQMVIVCCHSIKNKKKVDIFLSTTGKGERKLEKNNIMMKWTNKKISRHPLISAERNYQ